MSDPAPRAAPGGGRTPLVAGNWKMNTTVPEGVDLARDLASRSLPEGIEVVVLPTFIHLAPVREALDGSGIGVGAQDAFWEAAGAYTGEVSPVALRGLCDWALVGHSERRLVLGETDQQVHRKLRACLGAGLRVIVAVGETLAQREADETRGVVTGQLALAFAGLSEAEFGDRCVLAYEPVWAIGTGRTATPEQAQEVCAWLREIVGGQVSPDVASGMRILYGGSVTAANATSLFAQPDIDGGLVGGASLRAGEFADIVAAAGRERAPTR